MREHAPRAHDRVIRVQYRRLFLCMLRSSKGRPWKQIGIRVITFISNLLFPAHKTLSIPNTHTPILFLCPCSSTSTFYFVLVNKHTCKASAGILTQTQPTTPSREHNIMLVTGNISTFPTRNHTIFSCSFFKALLIFYLFEHRQSVFRIYCMFLGDVCSFRTCADCSFRIKSVSFDHI